MCHDTDARPPAPPADVLPEPHEIGGRGDLSLTSGDGTTVAAYEAFPVGEPRARVVVLPDVRGLHPYYRALADRLAEAGLHAVAIDYFGRTAADLPRDDDFAYMDHVKQVTPQQVTDDVSAAVRHLSPTGDGVLTLGFCFGGGHSWRLAAAGVGVAGAVGFYGRPSLVEEAVAGGGHAAPVLMLIAGADKAITVDDALAAADRLRASGAEVETQVFDGAPHSFFDRTFADHTKDCDEAWRLLLDFADRHAAPTHYARRGA
jgi:carboxymethylenebutenolidase